MRFDRVSQRLPALWPVDIQDIEWDAGDEADVGLGLGPPPLLDRGRVGCRFFQAMHRKAPRRALAAWLAGQNRPSSGGICEGCLTQLAHEETRRVLAPAD